MAPRAQPSCVELVAERYPSSLAYILAWLNNQCFLVLRAASRGFRAASIPASALRTMEIDPSSWASDPPSPPHTAHWFRGTVIAQVTSDSQAQFLARGLVSAADLIVACFGCGGNRITDAAAASLGACPCLRELFFFDCGLLTDAAGKHLASSRALQSLEFIRCDRLSDTVATAVAKCSTLTSVSFEANPTIGAAAAFALSKSKSLRSINLGGCSSVTDDVAISVATCASLRCLCLCDCKGVTDATGEALGASRLESLSLSGCYLTDPGVMALAHCGSLTSVDLSKHQSITDQAVEALSKGCPRLASANLSTCTRLTDAALGSLGIGCRQLEHVDFSGVTGITDTGVASLVLARNAPKESHATLATRHRAPRADPLGYCTMKRLHKASFRGCRLLTDDSAAALCRCSLLVAADLGYSKISDLGVGFFEQSTCFETLKVQYCRHVSRDACVRLVKSTAKRRIRVVLSNETIDRDSSYCQDAECPHLEEETSMPLWKRNTLGNASQHWSSGPW